MNLRMLNQQFSVCQISSISEVDFNDEFCFVGKSDDEISLTCSTEYVPKNALKVEHGWCCMKIEGILDFSLVGILAKIASILASEDISIYAVSTYNTDYILVKETNKEKAISILRRNDYIVY